MVIYVITLEPVKILSKKIKDIKTKVKVLVGDQLYLRDKPHLTLYLGDFKDIIKWGKRFGTLIKSIKKEICKIQIEISGWIIFKRDIMTGKCTLACNIAKRDIDILKTTQKKVIDFLKSYRSKKLVRRYKNVYVRFTNVERQNLERCGFPFVGKSWKPHFTIASLEKKTFNDVWAKIKNLCPKGYYNISSVNIYSLEGKEESMNLIKRYPLINR